MLLQRCGGNDIDDEGMPKAASNAIRGALICGQVARLLVGTTAGGLMMVLSVGCSGLEATGDSFELC